jgi:hypothetical protein
MSELLTCKVIKVTSPPLNQIDPPPVVEDGLSSSVAQDTPPSPPPNNIDIPEVVILQEEYTESIAAHGIVYSGISSSTFIAESVDSQASWVTHEIDVTSILIAGGNDRIMDFRYQNNGLTDDSAYIRNVVLTITTDVGETEVVFDYSNAFHFSNCDIYMHPYNTSGEYVNTYQYIPEITDTIVSASISFELADEWLCAQCCGNEESGTSVSVAIGMETVPVLP